LALHIHVFSYRVFFTLKKGVCDLSFFVFRQPVTSSMTGVTSGTGTANPSGAPEFTSGV
jgi:hypothetical protein